jgi:sterol desaturase/sphingolipid hydroxylase (fatty acid hydroxylase superfamily)
MVSTWVEGEAAVEPLVERRRVDLATLTVTAITTALVVLGVRAVGGLGAAGNVVAGERGELIGPVVVLFVAGIMVCERRWPAQARPFLARGQRTDLAYMALYATVVIPLVAVMGAGFVALLRDIAPWAPLPHLSGLALAGALGLAVVGMDAGNWWAHRLNHRYDPLWRLHAVHHSQEELSVLTSFRAHPLVHTSFLLASVPLFALTAHNALPSAVLVAYVCCSTLPHANVTWSFGPLGRVIVSPAYHRLHHRDAGRLDVNLGVVLTLFDRLSGRALWPEKGQVISTGLAGRPLPTETSGQHGVLGTWARQLVEPFVAPSEEAIPR